ncbi:MAG: hypothetical protein MSC30_07805 [Gaiellaceae bacterium MAG52_C11]|nr:hypothetical protein [Candidatus Gaiellasilicea maunaloa]
MTWAKLTPARAETLECVGVNHTERLRSAFRETLSEDDVAQLSELLGRLPGASGPAPAPAGPLFANLDGRMMP